MQVINPFQVERLPDEAEKLEDKKYNEIAKRPKMGEEKKSDQDQESMNLIDQRARVSLSTEMKLQKEKNEEEEKEKE